MKKKSELIINDITIYKLILLDFPVFYVYRRRIQKERVDNRNFYVIGGICSELFSKTSHQTYEKKKNIDID